MLFSRGTHIKKAKGHTFMHIQKFKGYYFRHQNDENTLAVIPGTAGDGAFIQVITDSGSKRFDFSDAEFGQVIRIGDNTFGTDGIHLNLPGIIGDIRYFGLTPIRSDIMGPFRFFPMECRHEIVSMRHDLQGSVSIDGKNYCFNGGVGYWEGDSGISFPSEYLWLQANDFQGGESFVLSVANIPFCGLHFKGVICVLRTGGKEYRLATYLGAKATVEGNRFSVRQRRLLLKGEILSTTGGFSLASPQNGKMQGIIREDNRAAVHIVLLRDGERICDLTSRRAGYERHPHKK